MAKVIAWGRQRDESIARMRRALAEMRVEGVPTTIPFHERLLADERFRRGEVHTRFVEDVFMAECWVAHWIAIHRLIGYAMSHRA